LKLIGFTHYLNPEYQIYDDLNEEEITHNLTIEYMREHGLRFFGHYHQRGKFRTPYFDNGKKLCLSLRGWGWLMAVILTITNFYSY
jgi:hypothetical protein